MGLLNRGKDVHEYTAKRLTHITGEEITRFHAKRTFFGLQYGIGPKKLAKTLGIDVDVAAKIIYGFSQEYGGLWEWMQDMIGACRHNGYIKTAYGRIIYVPVDEAYKGVNYYVQGTAGSILKTAKVKIAHFLKKNKWKAFITLPIHDELLIEYNPFRVDANLLDRRVIEAMQDNPQLNMPIDIPVSVNAIGKNWAEKKKVAVR
jgi:DNA polymerase I